MLENIRGHSRGSIPPLRMPSPLPHDLCHEWNVSRRLPAIEHLTDEETKTRKKEVIHSDCHNKVKHQLFWFFCSRLATSVQDQIICSPRTSELNNTWFNSYVLDVTTELKNRLHKGQWYWIFKWTKITYNNKTFYGWTKLVWFLKYLEN